jgi:uncharacterized protein with PQ loop repeat
MQYPFASAGAQAGVFAWLLLGILVAIGFLVAGILVIRTNSTQTISDELGAVVIAAIAIAPYLLLRKHNKFSLDHIASLACLSCGFRWTL